MTTIDPYEVLGVSPESDDETVRARYLELIKEFPPEHHAAKFSAIREAFEKIRDIVSRVEYRLFEHGKRDSIEQIVEEIACRKPRRRLGLRSLLQMQQSH